MSVKDWCILVGFIIYILGFMRQTYKFEESPIVLGMYNSVEWYWKIAIFVVLLLMCVIWPLWILVNYWVLGRDTE
jgi:hypothetical protein